MSYMQELTRYLIQELFLQQEIYLNPQGFFKSQNAIKVVKNSLAEDQSTIHYYQSVSEVAEDAQSRSVNWPRIDAFIYIST